MIRQIWLGLAVIGCTGLAALLFAHFSPASEFALPRSFWLFLAFGVAVGTRKLVAESRARDDRILSE